MFDSKELAEKALLRVEQINEEKRHKKVGAITIGTTLCVCIVGMLLILNTTDLGTTTLDQYPPRHIVEPEIPLADPTIEFAGFCSECGMEIEAEVEHCCYCEVGEECEYCMSE